MYVASGTAGVLEVAEPIGSDRSGLLEVGFDKMEPHLQTCGDDVTSAVIQTQHKRRDIHETRVFSILNLRGQPIWPNVLKNRPLFYRRHAAGQLLVAHILCLFHFTFSHSFIQCLTRRVCFTLMDIAVLPSLIWVSGITPGS